MSAIRTNSIRALIMSGLVNGLNTAEIGELLAIHFPGSQAAAKVSKHVGFYRAEMVKAGTIAKGTGAMQHGARVTAKSEAEQDRGILIEEIARLTAEIEALRAASNTSN